MITSHMENKTGIVIPKNHGKNGLNECNKQTYERARMRQKAKECEIAGAKSFVTMEFDLKHRSNNFIEPMCLVIGTSSCYFHCTAVIFKWLIDTVFNLAFFVCNSCKRCAHTKVNHQSDEVKDRNTHGRHSKREKRQTATIFQRLFCSFFASSLLLQEFSQASYEQTSANVRVLQPHTHTHTHTIQLWLNEKSSSSPSNAIPRVFHLNFANI